MIRRLSMEKRYKIIRCGQLYDGVTAEFKTGQSILVDGPAIAAVGPSVPEPEGAVEIDLRDFQVTPGMIDAHMHMDFIDWHTVREEVYTKMCIRDRCTA